MESDFRINTEQVGMQRTQVLELLRFQRNLGNQITKGKIGIDDNGSLKEHEKKDKMKELLDKYNSETLSRDEAKKLRLLLQDKQEESISVDDNILAMGIGFLVARLIAYLPLKEQILF